MGRRPLENETETRQLLLGHFAGERVSRFLLLAPFPTSSFFFPRNLHPRPAFLSPSIGTTHRLGWIHLASISKGRSFFEKASFFQDSWIKNHVDHLSDFLNIRLLIFRSLLKFWKMKRQVILILRFCINIVYYFNSLY